MFEEQSHHHARDDEEAEGESAGAGDGENGLAIEIGHGWVLVDAGVEMDAMQEPANRVRDVVRTLRG